MVRVGRHNEVGVVRLAVGDGVEVLGEEGGLLREVQPPLGADQHQGQEGADEDDHEDDDRPQDDRLHLLLVHDCSVG